MEIGGALSCVGAGELDLYAFSAADHSGRRGYAASDAPSYGAKKRPATTEWVHISASNLGTDRPVHCAWKARQSGRSLGCDSVSQGDDLGSLILSSTVEVVMYEKE